MNLLTIINGVKTFVRNVDFLDFSNNAFRIRLTGTSTADRVLTLPNDTGTFLLDDRSIGAQNFGVSMRGYEPLVSVTAPKILGMSDAGTFQNCVSTTSTTITIPLNATVAFPIGTTIVVKKTNVGLVDLVATSGVSILSETGATVTATARSVMNFVIIRKSATDTWIIQNPIPDNIFLPGFPTVNTPAVGNNSSSIATTAFVTTAIINAGRPALEASRPTTQSITTNAFTALICNTVQLDTNGAYNSTTGVFTTPVGQGGMYEYAIYAGFTVGANNIQFIPVKNSVRQENLRIPGMNLSTDSIFYHGATFKIRLVAGDTLSFECYYGSISGSVVTTSTVQFPSLSIYKVYT